MLCGRAFRSLAWWPGWSCLAAQHQSLSLGSVTFIYLYLHQQDVRPCFGQGNGHGLSNSPRPPSDQCRLALERKQFLNSGHPTQQERPWDDQDAEQKLGNGDAEPGDVLARGHGGLQRHLIRLVSSLSAFENAGRRTCLRPQPRCRALFWSQLLSAKDIALTRLPRA